MNKRVAAAPEKENQIPKQETECPEQKEETTQSSKRTYNQSDDACFGSEFGLNSQVKVSRTARDINEYDEFDFDFIAPSPKTPEFLSPNDNSPPYFDDIDVQDSLPETHTSQKERMVTEVDLTSDRIQADEIKEDINVYDETNLQEENVEINDFQRSSADHEFMQKQDNQLDAMFEKSSSDYIAVLERIADSFKAFDHDFLLNLFGEEKHEQYKKNQVERNMLRGQRRRLSLRIEEKRRSITCLSQLSKVSANSHASFTPQTSKSRSTSSSSSSTWRTNTPAFQNRNKSNVIVIEDDEDQPPGTGTNAKTSSRTLARFPGGSYEASQTNNGKRKKKKRKGKRRFYAGTKTRSKNIKTEDKKTDASSYNANTRMNKPIVYKYRFFSKNRNHGSGSSLPGLSIPVKKEPSW
ncbi:uncharacterized protein LOC114540582 [Dendronephthya gigantea]|uniref:uncharacterized protein LOC114540582 n=1 Tax=Dendronephthya gigantea TaxID=151771 RepID=UPI00106B8BC9|nr:uncharacterized protein LOC114540582 [Dendronephthya gigantea]